MIIVAFACFFLCLLLMWMAVELREVRASLLREEARADGAAGDAALWKCWFEDAIDAQSGLFAKLVRTRAALRDEIERQHELRDEQTDLAAAHLNSARWWEGCARANAINGERRERQMAESRDAAVTVADKRKDALLYALATLQGCAHMSMPIAGRRHLNALERRIKSTL